MGIKIKDISNEFGHPTCEITLSDRFKINSLKTDVMKKLIEAFGEAKKKKQAIVITNEAGTAFCAGLDRFEVLRSCATRGSCEIPLDYLVKLYKDLASHPYPTGCLVIGKAAGGGVGLAMCCRNVVTTENVTFRLPAGGYRDLARVLLPIIAHRNPNLKNIEDFIGDVYDAGRMQADGLIDSYGSDVLVERKKLKALLEAQHVQQNAVSRFSQATLDRIDDAQRRAKKPESTRAIVSGLIYQTMRSVERHLGR